ncbi:MAG: SufS family cysteine desulfurase [Colwellia sp.]|nr:SufS family cysteine desulfurase [Colwellia sp.]
MNLFEPCQFRQQFPLIANNEDSSIKNGQSQATIVYFDNAATTQKPLSVIESQQDYYQQCNANVHRASHQLSAQATFKFEQARKSVQEFIGAKSIKEVIWTKGTTESINLVCQSLARNTLKRHDEIVVCASEHHANIVSWQIVAQQTGAVIKVLPLTPQGYIDLTQLDHFITSKTRFVACAHISNVLGKVNPIKQVIARAQEVGAISLIDGAQAVAHLNVDVQALGCDFYVFSAHKMYGPTGVGVLYGKKQLLELMTPYQGGGEMIKAVSFDKATTYNDLPFKFEAGTPNIAGIIGFSATINFLQPYLRDTSKGYVKFEQQLTLYCYQKMAAITQVKFIIPGAPDIGVIAFRVSGHHNHDVATTLDKYGIAVRSGHHCAMPLMTSLNIDGCLRVSLSAYNTHAEVDYFINCLQEILLEESEEEQYPNIASAGDSKGKQSTQGQENLQLDEVIRLFSKAKGWDGRHREIMLLGKKLPRLDKALRNEQTLIAGCESSAWLSATEDEQGMYSFSADSDAKIIRGLLVIVLVALNNKNAEQIRQFDIENYFTKLGLLQHLSPSRSNGLLAIVDKIKSFAEK